jgi:hypothetical protein
MAVTSLALSAMALYRLWVLGAFRPAMPFIPIVVGQAVYILIQNKSMDAIENITIRMESIFMKLLKGNDSETDNVDA